MDPAGNTLRERRFGPFHLAERCYAPGAKLPVHQHANAYISLALSGSYVETSHSDERACSSGTVIWHPQGEAHADHFHSAGGLVLDLEIDSAWLDDAAQDFDVLRSSHVCCGGMPYRFALRLYHALSTEGDAAPDLALELVGCFLSTIAERQPPQWFRRALQLADALSCDDRLTLAAVAQQVGVHPVHVARSFRRFTGCTFGDYIGQRRIRRAFDLLLMPARSIADVAYECGFADHAHLCRTFKRTTGLTPSQFRNNSPSLHRGAEVKVVQALTGACAI